MPRASAAPHDAYAKKQSSLLRRYGRAAEKAGRECHEIIGARQEFTARDVDVRLQYFRYFSSQRFGLNTFIDDVAEIFLILP